MREVNVVEMKKILMDILQCIDKFCSQEGIVYYAGYGTLLGAVRHQGFIPWDDDIDLLMERSDYEKFIRSFPNDPNGEICMTNAKIDARYPYTYAKVYYTKSKVKEYLYKPYVMGINIDIFPIDNWGDGIEKHYKQLKRLRRSLKAKTCRFSSYRSMKVNIGLAGMKILTVHRSKKKIMHQIENFSTMDNRHKKLEYVGNITANVYGKREKMKKEWFAETTRMKFENFEIVVPAGYHEILTTLYGEYMILPPEEKRVSHHSSKAWILE